MEDTMSDNLSACRAALVPYLGNFHIHGIPNDTVAGPVSCVGDQLAVPDAVIVPSVRPLVKDGIKIVAAGGVTGEKEAAYPVTGRN